MRSGRVAHVGARRGPDNETTYLRWQSLQTLRPSRRREGRRGSGAFGTSWCEKWWMRCSTTFGRKGRERQLKKAIRAQRPRSRGAARCSVGARKEPQSRSSTEARRRRRSRRPAGGWSMWVWLTECALSDVRRSIPRSHRADEAPHCRSATPYPHARRSSRRTAEFVGRVCAEAARRQPGKSNDSSGAVGGERAGAGSGVPVGSPRWRKIRATTGGSSIVAMKRRRPPQPGHARTSIAKTRRSSSAHAK